MSMFDEETEAADEGSGSGSGSNGVKKSELEAYLVRVERLEEAKAEIAEDIKQIKTEAKSSGYDMKAFNAMLSLRKKDQNTREMIGHYADVLGVFG